MRMTRLIERLIGATLFLSLMAGAQAGTDRGIAFRIETDPPSYLLGSVHVGRASMYPLPEAVRSAYARSGVLVVEADIVGADMTRLAGLVAEHGLYGEGGDLQSALSPAAWADVTTAAERYGVPVSMLQRQRPWLAAQTLTVLAMRAQGYSEQWGVDRHFLQLAHEDGKHIVELEGLDTQMAMLAEMPESDQAAWLAHTAEQMVEGDIPVAELLSAWQSGHTRALQRQVEEQFPPALEGVYERLIVARNRTMTERIAALLENGQSVFVVVGAAHMTGGSGLVELLRERGYKVDAL